MWRLMKWKRNVNLPVRLITFYESARVKKKKKSINLAMHNIRQYGCFCQFCNGLDGLHSLLLK